MSSRDSRCFSATSLVHIRKRSMHTNNLNVVPADKVEVNVPEVAVSESDGGSYRKMWERVKLFVFCSGIFVFYFYYGILQENITKSKYGPEEEPFVFTQALVFIQCIINALFAYGSLLVQGSERDTTSKKLYAACAFSYVGAMLASNKALQWVAYPTQVLGKSVKPIPVMILGVLLARKVYPRAKYFFIFLIVAGVALFMYKDNKAKASESGFGIGEMLLIVSLTMDGLTGAAQERMRSEHQTSSHHMMLNMNLWSLVYMSFGLVLTGEGLAFLSFMQKYPYVLGSMLKFSLCSAIGQTFIFLTVSHYGPLVCSVVTTTRKFFTILGSVLLFGHPMLGRQWLGTILVFVGLALDSRFGKEIKPVKASVK